MFRRYYSFKQSPDLVKTQKAKARAAARQSKLERSILDKLRSITAPLTSPFRG